MDCLSNVVFIINYSAIKTLFEFAECKIKWSKIGLNLYILTKWAYGLEFIFKYLILSFEKC